MASTQHASASVPIRVARQNIYATLAFQVKGSLAQAYKEGEPGTCTPNWSGGNGPVITPIITVPSSINVTNAVYKWYRNDKAGGEPAYIGDSTGEQTQYPSLFDIDPETGALTIKDNLASASNTDPDTFTCEVTATVEGQSVTMTRSISCTILPASSSGYVVTIEADNTVLSSDVVNCLLTATLWICDDGTKVSSGVTWAWENGDGDSKGATNAITVSRDDVDWEQLYRVEATLDGSVVGVGTVTVQDVADNYKLEASIDGEVSSSQAATVTIALYQRKSDEEGWTAFAPTGATYTAKVLDTEDTDVGTLKTDADLTDGKATFEVTYDDMQRIGNGIYAGYVNVTATW